MTSEMEKDILKVLVSEEELKGRVQELGAENIGLTLERGAIACDEHLVSSLPNIYVVGDANGKAMLAHTAFKEAEIAELEAQMADPSLYSDAQKSADVQRAYQKAQQALQTLYEQWEAAEAALSQEEA